MVLVEVTVTVVAVKCDLLQGRGGEYTDVVVELSIYM
jgi:hypothetical protein